MSVAKARAVKAILFALDGPASSDPRMAGLSLFRLALYDQPALRYCFVNLLQWGIRDILVVGPGAQLMPILGDGAGYGMRISYVDPPEVFDLFGILQQYAKFLEGESVCLMSAHNFFWGAELADVENPGGGAKILAQRVVGREHYSVLEMDSLPWRVPDLGFYAQGLLEVASKLSSSGSLSLDLEVLNRRYADENRLEVVRVGGEVVWCDLQDWDSLWEAARQAEAWEEMTTSKAACLEEVALHTGIINAEQGAALFERYAPGLYREYLKGIFISAGIWPEEERGLRLV